MHTVVEALRAALPPHAVVTDDETRDRLSHDDAEWADYAMPAWVTAATARPASVSVRK